MAASTLKQPLPSTSGPKDNADAPSTHSLESWEILCLDDAKAIIPVETPLHHSTSDLRRDSGVTPNNSESLPPSEKGYTTSPPKKDGGGGLRIVTRKPALAPAASLDWLEETPYLFTPPARASGAAMWSPVYPQPPALSARIAKRDWDMPVYYYPLWPRSPLLSSAQISTPPHIGEALEQMGSEADGTGMLRSARSPY